MNKKQQRELENKIREVMEEPADLTDDEIADIRIRAYLAYQKKMADEKQSSKSRKKKSGFLRRVVAVFAIAIGLIVVSIVYSVLAPVTVGNANSFVRRAAIWVNDQLHLGISFPVPEQESNVINTEQSSFSSIEQASKALNMPIVYIQDEVENLSFCGVETAPSSDHSSIVFVHYKAGDNNIDISIEKLHDDEILDISSWDLIKFTSSIGEVFIWQTEDIKRATGIYNGYLIEIYSSAPLDLLLTCCRFLAVVN